jgi:hypothetical protein
MMPPYGHSRMMPPYGHKQDDAPLRPQHPASAYKPHSQSRALPIEITPLLGPFMLQRGYVRARARARHG